MPLGIKELKALKTPLALTSIWNSFIANHTDSKTTNPMHRPTVILLHWSAACSLSAWIATRKI